jgi:hypothetical protein
MSSQICNHEGKSSFKFTLSLPVGCMSLGENLIFHQLPANFKVILCLYTIQPLSMFSTIINLNMHIQKLLMYQEQPSVAVEDRYCNQSQLSL